MRRAAPAAFSLCALTILALSGCGGTGGGGGGETRKTFVLPHVLEKSGLSVAAGDVNGDGVMDLFVHDPVSSSVSVMLSSALRESPAQASVGHLPPTLASKGKYARGTSAYSGQAHVFVWNSAADLGVGDVDGDGRLDLLVAGGAAGQVGVWLSRSIPENSVEFLSPVVLDTGGSADRVAAGDVDGDGRTDVVCLDESTGQARVFLQASSSPLAFVVGNDPPAVGRCFGMVCADVDRDGHLDLVTNRFDVDMVTMILDVGTSAVAIRESPTRQSTGRSMAVADVDGDGWLDICVLGEGGTDLVCLRQLSVQPGTFDPVSTPLGIAIDEQGAHFSMILGPPRGRGAAAGIAVNEEGTHNRGIAVNEEGTHNLGIAIDQPGLALCDLDRDGRLDLIGDPPPGDPDFDLLCFFASATGTPGAFDGSKWERLGPPAGGFLSSTSGIPACACDLDRDGHVDLVRCDPDEGTVSLLYSGTPDGDPAPEYAQRWVVDTTPPIVDAALCDFDRDGFVDVVTATGAGIEVRFQDPAAPGTYGAPTSLAAAQAFVTVAVGDVNGDGCADLVCASPFTAATFLRDPQKPREFTGPIFFPPLPGGNLRSLALADVDDDGHLDCVAVRESPSKASLGRGMGNGFFDVFTEIDIAILDPLDVAVADLDGDGRLDLAFCGTDGSAVVRQADPGGGPVKWLAPETVGFAYGNLIRIGDLDEDGRPDLVTSGGGNLIVALQGPTGDFLASYSLSTVHPAGFEVCDADRNGIPDVCYVETDTGDLVCKVGDYLDRDSDDDGATFVRLNGLPPGEPVIATLLLEADLDGDGDLDVVVCSPAFPGAANGSIRSFLDTH